MPRFAALRTEPRGTGRASIGRYIGGALGSFAVNIAIGFDATSALAIVRSCGFTATIAGGAALQAVVGAALIRRWVGDPGALQDERDIVRFIALGGPLACLVCATVSVTTLSVAGVVAWSGFAFHWWTWWVGDTIGVLVFAPLARLVLGGHPVWRRRRGIVGVQVRKLTGEADRGRSRSARPGSRRSR
jgi:integral membrane sensor domain MASE1